MPLQEKIGRAVQTNAGGLASIMLGGYVVAGAVYGFFWGLYKLESYRGQEVLREQRRQEYIVQHEKKKTEIALNDILLRRDDVPPDMVVSPHFVGHMRYTHDAKLKQVAHMNGGGHD